MRTCTLSLVLWLFWGGLFAQFDPLTFVWEKRTGFAKEDAILSAFLDMEGHLKYSGFAQQSQRLDKDIYLGFYPFQENKAARIIPRPADDQVNAFIQLHNGNFLMAGMTNSKARGYRGMKDGLVVLIDGFSQQVLSDTLIGSAGEDLIYDVVQDDQDDIWMCGEMDGKPWLIRSSSDINRIISSRVFFDLHDGSAESILQTSEGKIAVSGYVGKNRRADLFLIIYDPQTGQHSTSILPRARARDMIENDLGELVIIGDDYSNARNKSDGLWVRFQLDGTLIADSRQTFGHFGEDGFEQIIQSHDRSYFVAGYYRSHAFGAVRNQGWILHLDENGELLEEVVHGEDFEDYYTSLVAMPKGEIIACGYSASQNAEDEDLWLSGLQGQSLPKAEPVKGLITTPPVWVEEQEDNTLNAGEKSYFRFQIINQGQRDAFDIRARTSGWQELKEVKSFSELYIGHIKAGASKTVYVPVAAADSMSDGMLRLKLSFEEHNNSVIRELSMEVPTRRKQEARLEVPDYVFITSNPDGRLRRNQPLRLRLNIMNRGTAVAQSAEIRFSHKNNIRALSNERVDLPTIFPGTATSIEYEFKVDYSHISDTLNIQYLIKREDGRYHTGVATTILETLPVIPHPQPIRNDILVVTWLNPNPDEIGGFAMQLTEQQIQVKLKAQSNKPLQVDHFTVLVNGQEPAAGQKLKTVRLRKPDNASDVQDGLSSYTYIQTLLLQPGDNKVQVIVNNEAGRAESKVFNFIYNEKPNAHILAIGVPFYDLKYTSKDARDIANVFRKQELGLFNEVFVEELVDSVSTTAKKLEERFATLVHDYGRKIKSNDVLIIFISSHGVSDLTGKRFGIYGSDYDPYYGSARMIDYETEFIDQIRGIPCKKLVLIDACQSGAITYTDAIAGSKGLQPISDISQALVALNEAAEGIRAISSCSATELSYEDDTWQNGAFTEGILEAFGQAGVSGSNGNLLKANANDDRVLTLNELYHFLKVRVPSLVRSDKPQAKTSQTPYMSEADQAEDFPLFFFQ